MEKIKKQYILMAIAIFFTPAIFAGSSGYSASIIQEPGLLIKGRSKKLYFITGPEAAHYSHFFRQKLIQQESSQRIITICLDFTDEEMQFLTQFLATLGRLGFALQKRALDQKIIDTEIANRASFFFTTWAKNGWKKRSNFCEEIVTISNSTRITHFVNREKDCFLFHWRRLVFMAHQLGMPLLTHLCASYFVLSGCDFNKQIKKLYRTKDFFWQGMGEDIKSSIKACQEAFDEQARENRQIYIRSQKEKKLRSIFKSIDALLNEL